MKKMKKNEKNTKERLHLMYISCTPLTISFLDKRTSSFQHGFGKFKIPRKRELMQSKLKLQHVLCLCYLKKPKKLRKTTNLCANFRYPSLGKLQNGSCTDLAV